MVNYLNLDISLNFQNKYEVALGPIFFSIWVYFTKIYDSRHNRGKKEAISSTSSSPLPPTSQTHRH